MLDKIYRVLKRFNKRANIGHPDDAETYNKWLANKTTAIQEKNSISTINFSNYACL